MNWLWVLVGIIALWFVLKFILKTLKIMLVFVILAILVIVFVLWQRGLLGTVM